MASPVVTGKKGAAKVYNIDLDAIVKAGGIVSDKELSAEVKLKDGTSKTYTQMTKEVVITDLAQALASTGNDESLMWKLYSRSLNGQIQAKDRVTLRNATLGPAKNAVRMVNSMTACNVPVDIAISTVVGLLAAQNITVTAEEIKAEL